MSLRWAAAAAMLAAPALADEILNNPGYCALPDGERELADIIYLTPTEVSAHWVGCTWSEPVAVGSPATRVAQCDDGATTWQARIRFGALTSRTIRVEIEPENNLPRYFFPCAEWGG